MIKKIYKISFLAALLGSFSFFVGCDEASEPKTAAQESSEHPGSQGDSFVSSESNKSVTLTVDVQDKKEEGFQLLASADSFLVKILCDSGSQYVGQKTNTFTLQMGDTCSSELEAFEVSGKLYKQDPNAKNYYKDDDDKSFVITPSRDANELGGWDANFAPTSVQIDGSHAGYQFGYNFAAVEKDLDDANVVTESSFLKSKEQDANTVVNGHKAPIFSLVEHKNINAGNTDQQKITSVDLLLEGTHFGASIEIHLCDGNDLAIAHQDSGCGSNLLSDSNNIDLSLKDLHDEGWHAAGVTSSDIPSGAKAYQVSLSGLDVDRSSDTTKYLHIRSADASGKQSKLVLPIELSKSP